VKILMWDVSGYWVACKRLEHGRFAVRGKRGPDDAKGCYLMSVAEVMNMLEGIDVRHARYLNHYEVIPDRVKSDVHR
jgi:hypothetical protein